jgi:hypothetical protein
VIGQAAALARQVASAYARRLFVCADQSGRTSAPINPHRVQTIREHSERTGISSGSPSALMTLWWHQGDRSLLGSVYQWVTALVCP